MHRTANHFVSTLSCQWLAFLLKEPTAPGSSPSSAKIFSLCCLVRGQYRDQTHLELKLRISQLQLAVKAIAKYNKKLCPAPCVPFRIILQEVGGRFVKKVNWVENFGRTRLLIILICYGLMNSHSNTGYKFSELPELIECWLQGRGQVLSLQVFCQHQLSVSLHGRPSFQQSLCGIGCQVHHVPGPD